MSPDSFGPITVDTTVKEAVATGAFKVSPAPCSKSRLDWHTQTYRHAKADDSMGPTAQWPVNHGLPDLMPNYKKPGMQFIDAGRATVTDRGIRHGDSEAKLKRTYGRSLIPGPYNGAPGDPSNAYAINGKHSYLLVLTTKGKVDTFFITPGTVKTPRDILDGRGGPC